jgi:hypothetical protein
MAIESVVEQDEGFVRVTNSGVGSATAFNEMTERLLGHPLIQPGARVLVDNRAIDYSHVTSEDVRERASELTSRADALAPFRIAVLVESVANFGTQRITSLIAGEAFPNARGFTDLDDAIAWLTGDD